MTPDLLPLRLGVALPSRGKGATPTRNAQEKADHVGIKRDQGTYPQVPRSRATRVA
jgi:hypothetical protein